MGRVDLSVINSNDQVGIQVSVPQYIFRPDHNYVPNLIPPAAIFLCRSFACISQFPVYSWFQLLYTR